ncbi:FecR domain-containing protein [uncultured Draconibacterium sp.]|uniref:FecR domain-containing protein n=1 Tax=uncultured Draconibacterium sp. TaxID=1573823 RepID=UPI00326113BE
MRTQNIDQIITRKLAGEISNEELAMLNNWLAESEENRKEYAALVQLWDKSKKLYLSEEIDVELALKQTRKRIGFSTKTRWIIYARQAAAVLLLSVALSFFYNYITPLVKTETAQESIYQEIRASFGTQTKVTLADGTSVWLNSGSSLRFPTSFNKSKNREVELNGEGYFEVIKNTEKPFVVNTSTLGVKVYGTSFNVTAYKKDKSMMVALVEGKVSMIERNGKEGKELLILKPNDVVEYKSEENKIYHKVEPHMYKYTAWKEGKIVFFNDPISVVVQRLQKWYNVDVEINDQRLFDYRFTATFIDESLEQVFKLLCLSSQMQYEIIPSKKLNDDSFTKRKVILTIK